MDATKKWNNRTKNSHTYSRSTAYVKKSTYKNIYIYIYTYIWMSLRPRYSRAFKLDPPGTDSHRRTSSPGRSWNCKGSAGSTPSCWRWHAASAKGGSAGGGDGSGMCSDTSETFSTNPSQPTGLRPGNGTEVQKGGEGRLIYYISLFAKGDFLSSMQRCFKSNH